MVIIVLLLVVDKLGFSYKVYFLNYAKVSIKK